jgi:hypothetical protein
MEAETPFEVPHQARPSAGFLLPAPRRTTMKTFKSAACLEKVRGDPLHDTLREVLTS